jgi:hypothetical protein
VLLVVIVVVTVAAHCKDTRDVHIAPFPSVEEPYRPNSSTILEELRTTPCARWYVACCLVRLFSTVSCPPATLCVWRAVPRRRHRQLVNPIHLLPPRGDPLAPPTVRDQPQLDGKPYEWQFATITLRSWMGRTVFTLPCWPGSALPKILDSVHGLERWCPYGRDREQLGGHSSQWPRSSAYKELQRSATTCVPRLGGEIARYV